MATDLLTRPLDRSYLLRGLRAFYRRRLTERGRFVLWATVGVALVEWTPDGRSSSSSSRSPRRLSWWHSAGSLPPVRPSVSRAGCRLA